MQSKQNFSLAFWQLVLLAGLVLILTQALHESGHWALYQLYGRGPVWGFTSLVQTWETPPKNPQGWVETTGPQGERGWLRLSSAPDSPLEDGLEAAAGPLASLAGVLAGLAAWRLAKQPLARQAGLMFLLVGSFMMSTYYLRSSMRSGGDEHALALAMGVPKPAVELAFGLAFGACFVLWAWAMGGWRQALRWLVAMLLGITPATLLLITGEGLVRSQVSLGNPWFAGLAGFSAPVLVVNSLALFGLAAWLYGNAYRVRRSSGRKRALEQRL